MTSCKILALKNIIDEMIFHTVENGNISSLLKSQWSMLAGSTFFMNSATCWNFTQTSLCYTDRTFYQNACARKFGSRSSTRTVLRKPFVNRDLFVVLTRSKYFWHQTSQHYSRSLFALKKTLNTKHS